MRGHVFSKVKVGDRILYHDRGSPTHRYIGKKGTVSDVRNNGSTADVVFDGDSRGTQVSTANIEVIPMNNFSPGDKVRIVKKGSSCEAGFNNSWLEEMNRLVGDNKEYEVVGQSVIGVKLHGVLHSYPPSSLELVGSEVDKAIALLKQHGTVTFVPKFKPISMDLNDQHEAVIHKDHVKVGCQTFRFDRVLMLAEMVKKVQAEQK